MKRKHQKPVLVLFAAFLSLNVTVTAIAADFFPLDIWDEVKTWQPIDEAAFDHGGDFSIETTPGKFGMTRTVDVFFPFDVLNELNGMGGVDRRSAEVHRRAGFFHSSAKDSEGNPYWMPKELVTH